MQDLTCPGRIRGASDYGDPTSRYDLELITAGIVQNPKRSPVKVAATNTNTFAQNQKTLYPRAKIPDPNQTLKPQTLRGDTPLDPRFLEKPNL